MEQTRKTKSIKLHLSGLETVIVQPDGNDETAVYEKDSNKARALLDFCARCVVRLGDIEKPSIQDIGRLSEPDCIQVALGKLSEPDYIQVALNVYCMATSKRTLKLGGACAKCGKPNGAVIDLTPWLEPEIPDYITGPDPTWEIYLPETGNHVVYGYPIAEKEIETLGSGKLDLNYSDWIAIRSVDGSDRVKLREVASWPMPDHIAFREALMAKREWYETRIGLKHSCGFWEEVNFLLDPRFVWPGLIV
jgi:hypothetical protein